MDMNSVLEAVAASLEFISVFICINYMYDQKYRISVYDMWFFVLELALLEIMNLHHLGRPFIILSYILIFVYQEFKFRKGFRITCLNIMLLSCIEVTLQLVCSILVFWENYIPIEYLVIVSNILLVALIFLLGKKSLLYKMTEVCSKHELLLNISVVICFFASVYLIIVTKLAECLRRSDYFIFGAWTIMLFIMALKWQETKDEKRLKEKELEIHNIYNEATLQLIRSVSRKQHEFDNHVQAILGQHILADSLEDLIERQNRYYKDIQKNNHYNKLLAAGTSPVIGFLYSKFIYAESKGCEVEYNIRTGELSCSMPHFRMIEILGIFIDNAIEAQSGEEDKRIRVEMLEDAERIRIQVKNPCKRRIPNYELEQFVREGFSTKGKDRGRGLANVADIVAQYKADLLICNQKMKDKNYIVFQVIIDK